MPASDVTSSPPTTSDSLFASASRLPAAQRRDRGAQPGGADERVEHDVGVSARGELRERRRRPASDRGRPGSAARASAAPRRSASATRRDAERARLLGEQRARCACAASATTSTRSGKRAATSSAWRPIDPVEPRTASADGPRHSAPRARATSVVDATIDDHDHAVEPVEEAAVTGQQRARVLHARLALEARLDEVADERGDRHGDADDDEPRAAAGPSRRAASAPARTRRPTRAARRRRRR